VADIRSRLDHPIIDTDGHQMEFLPLVREFLGDNDPKLLDRFDDYAQMSPQNRLRGTRGAFWPSPAENTLDRMSATLPGLLYERMEELGFDYALLYPTGGLICTLLDDPELRPALARAFNQYNAEAFAGYRDRLEPVAVIPTFTPEEAIDELEFVVRDLGLKAVVMGAVVPRDPTDDGPNRPWIDTLGHGSRYDYDPLWAKCVELGVTPTFHGVGYGWGTRASTRNYVYNHLGSFAAAQEAACRSIFMGGVAKRFPELRFAFLEGGVSWACQLYFDILGHYDKRNKNTIMHLDPARIDLDEAARLWDEFGSGRLGSMREQFVDSVRRQVANPEDPAMLDEWAEAQISGPDDVGDVFSTQFFFGCEADDPLNSLAFDRRILPESMRLNAVFASDIGHWDVPEMNGVLTEAWELVEDGRLSADDFRDFSCVNAVRMLTAANADFFAGTAVADTVLPYMESTIATS
jgi:predicted TIM-barrel fold metal-dependent hydrolase